MAYKIQAVKLVKEFGGAKASDAPGGVSWARNGAICRRILIWKRHICAARRKRCTSMLEISEEENGNLTKL